MSFVVLDSSLSTALASRCVEGVVGSQLFLGSRPTQSKLFPTRVKKQPGCWESSRTSACVALICFVWTEFISVSAFLHCGCGMKACSMWFEGILSFASAVGVKAPVEPPLFDQIIKQWKKVREISYQILSIIMFILYPRLVCFLVSALTLATR